MPVRRPRTKSLVLAAVAGAIAAAVALLLLLVPIAQVSSGDTMIGANAYSYESENLFGPGTGWENFSYRGVTFTFHLWCATTPAAGVVCGTATGPDGVAHAYAFSDGPPRAGPPSWETWVAPDGHEAVEYQQGGLVHLLVEV